MEWQGFVLRKKRQPDAKNQDKDLVLRTTRGDFALRPTSSTPFQDKALEGLEGKHIRCSGELAGGELFLSSWKIEN